MSERLDDIGPAGRAVGFLVFDLGYRLAWPLTAAAGGAALGGGLDLADRTVAGVVGVGGAAAGALLGLAMWCAGPGRRIAGARLWVAGSAFLGLLWGLVALAVFAAIQQILWLAAGTWEATPAAASAGAAVGFLLGGLAKWSLGRWLRGRQGPPAAPDGGPNAEVQHE
jgi:hypothetical protein